MTTNAKRRKLRVLFAGSECVPFVKTGGLADVAGSLPRALKHAGARVAVILPKYSSIPQEYRDQMRHVADFYVPLAWQADAADIEGATEHLMVLLQKREIRCQLSILYFLKHYEITAFPRVFAK